MGSGNGQHPYQACRDEQCERYACRIWKEAWREAYREGRDDGWRQCWPVAHAQGIRDCPLPHQG